MNWVAFVAYSADIFHKFYFSLLSILIIDLSANLSTLEVNPNTAQNSPCDGHVGQFYGPGSGVVWATIKAGAGNEIDYLNSDPYVYCMEIKSDNVSPNFRILRRSIFLFDTSALTAGATISDTVLSLYGESVLDQAGNAPRLDVYLATPAATNALVFGDFTQIGTTSQTGSPIAYASWSTVGYNAFTFNATGKGNVSKIGISKFGTRDVDYDVGSGTPTYGGTYFETRMTAYTADNGSNKPKLVITYSLASNTGNFFYFL